MLLFIAAFHGNLCYVLSVLSSPLVQTEEGYLFESVPFLLGSGGTLVFDMMIMFQACIYRNRAPRTPRVPQYSHSHQHHHHGKHHDTEEIAGLLAHSELLGVSERRDQSMSRSRSRPAPRSRTASGEYRRSSERTDRLRTQSASTSAAAPGSSADGRNRKLPSELTPSAAEELPDIPFVRQVSEEWV